MSDNETIADILREWRDMVCYCEKDIHPLNHATVMINLDRIEAAAKREVEDAERRGNHAATKAICETIEKVGPLYDAESIGSAAKLREALEKIGAMEVPHNFQAERSDIADACYDLTRAIKLANAALAEPPRNCDVGTAEEQTERFKQLCRKYRRGPGPRTNCKGCPIQHESLHVGCTFAWAQMPYAESEAGKGGKE